MRINFIKASPSQNMTVFITSYVHPTNYVTIANKLMTDELLSAEQVGYIVPARGTEAVLRLEMSGGEFCGNGLLSAAAYCHYQGITKENVFQLEISGSDDSLTCEVEQKSTTLFQAKGEMPQPVSMKEMNLNFQGEVVYGSIVQLQGITHFITDYVLETDQYDLLLEELRKKVIDKAIGIIPYKQINKNKYEIRPFVFVEQSGSKVFERACGSGSLSLGVFLAKQGDERVFEVIQPGGTITVEIGEQNFISTDVLFTCEGAAMIPMGGK